MSPKRDPARARFSARPRLRRIASTVGRTRQEVIAHWRRERRTIRQGLTALGISTAVGMAAGLVLGSMEGLLARYNGLLILVPAAIGMRGAIFGALGARLGTGIITGEFTPLRLRGNSDDESGEPAWHTFTGQNVLAAISLTFASSALAALTARATAALFGLRTIDVWQLMTVSMVGGLLASAFILVGVMRLASAAVRRDWDMDAIGSPLITATGDIVTLPALALATLLLLDATVSTVTGVVLLLTAVLVVGQALTRSGRITRRVVRESLPVLTFAAVVDILAGTVLETRLDAFVSSPALLVLVPPFIANCGSLGGILSARLGSDLHLGLISPRLVPERLAGLESSITVLFALVAFPGVGLIAHVASRLAGLHSPGLLPLVGIALGGGLLAVTLLIAVSYSAATATYRFGLDPDNYGIPIVTATMDFFGVLCLVAAIVVSGV